MPPATTNIAAVPLAPPPLLAQDFVRLEAAVKVDDTLYVGEHRLVLGEGGVDDIEMKLVKIRWAGCTGQQVGGGHARRQPSAARRVRACRRRAAAAADPSAAPAAAHVPSRAALKRNSSPDLAAALHGVTRVKLFLAGEAVRAGLAVDELVNLAAAVGASVVLPSGQALGLAAEPAPAVQL